ncbi:hypothetical protein GJV03_06210 [Acinetobacter sp. RIT698]|jgi:hypothetical protein|nr:hypothetical protein F981_04510 [Acinetobacter guillouiae CIP 63.46]KAB0623348.1 hypothetical protein F7P82_21535 [Acinetobacter guillouiae]MRT36752.1 hypothetical protein [Acinetobacter sp. RIT698]
MRNLLENHKVSLSFSILFLLACSISTTIISKDLLSDSISITSSVVLSAGFLVVFAMIFLDFLESVCNP